MKLAFYIPSTLGLLLAATTCQQTEVFAADSDELDIAETANLPPRPEDDTAITDEDTPVTIDVVENDWSQGPMVATPMDCTNGIMTIDPATGIATYTPETGFCGTTNCEYQVESSTGATDTAIVTITVNCAPNNPPIAVDNLVTTDENTPVSVDVLDNDSDVDIGDVLTAYLVIPETCLNGQIVMDISGVATYTPNRNYCGTDSCDYTLLDGNGGSDIASVDIDVLCANDPPIAVDDIAETIQDQPISIAILDNDADIDDDELTATPNNDCSSGVMTSNIDNNEVTYTPDVGFCGRDTCTYTLGDGPGNGGTDSAHVAITVLCVNDPPIAEDDTATTPQDTPVTLNVLENDSDIDLDKLTAEYLVGSCANGDITSLDNHTGVGTYEPNPGFCGMEDSCAYLLLDGNGGSDSAIVTVDVICVNEPPVAVNDRTKTDKNEHVTLNVLDNDSDPDVDDLTSTFNIGSCEDGDMTMNSSGETTYTPNLDFCGRDVCDYTLSDGNGGTDTATVVITVDCGGGANGDPHFKTWAGEKYDFHGICDLILLENSAFQNGLGMDIYIRTKKMKQFSYISNVVLRIGKDVFELMSDKSANLHYWINGMEGTEKDFVDITLAGYPVSYRHVNSKQHEVTFDLGNNEKIVMKTWKELVRVDISGATSSNFESSSGLMGSFADGAHLARGDNNKSVLDDINEFGQEWQVRVDDPQLFHNLEGPQAPEQCMTPSTSSIRRHLRESLITQTEAELACSDVDESDRELCVFDVMATNDMEVAGAY